jgi:hypothetical protein
MHDVMVNPTFGVLMLSGETKTSNALDEWREKVEGAVAQISLG